MPLWLLLVLGTALLGVGAGGSLVLSHWFTHPAAAHGKSAEAAPAGPPQYLVLKPFVVNFQAGQLVRYLQVSIQVMSRDPKTIKLLQQNDPVVRNDLLLLLGGQQYTTLDTEAGKEQLRQSVLTAIRNVVGQAGGHPERVAAVYFTSFVMQ